MLDITGSRYNPLGSEMKDLLSTINALEEGSCVVGTMEAGQLKAGPSAGSNAEVFLGVALNEFVNPTTIAVQEEITVPAASVYTVTLGFTPEANSLSLFANNPYAAFTLAGSASGTTVASLTGKVLTFHSTDASKTVTVRYRRALSVAEAGNLFGQNVVPGGAGVINRSGVITQAEFLFTDKFDPASNWSAGGPVYTFANGLFSLNTGGTLLRNVAVHAAPTPAYPYLGLRLN